MKGGKAACSSGVGSGAASSRKGRYQEHNCGVFERIMREEKIQRSGRIILLLPMFEGVAGRSPLPGNVKWQVQSLKL